MKFFATLAAFVALVAAVPTTEDAPIENLEKRQGCWVGQPNMGVVDTIYRVGQNRGLNDKLMLALFETARVESNFNNLRCGDKDSVGVFQQRPSVKAWGSYNEILDVGHATNAFLDALLACYNRNSGRSSGQLAQCAQVSEIPDAYDRAQGFAREMLNSARARNGGGGGNGGAVNVGGKPSSGGSSSGGSSSGSCQRSVTAARGDSCARLASKGHTSVSNIRKLNSGINGGCTNIQIGKKYCVQKGKASSAANTNKGASGGCQFRTTAKAGDTCAALAGRGKISVQRFRDLNGGINGGCTNIQIGKSYCTS